MAFLGVDIGSVSVKTALVSDGGDVLAQSYRRHYGQPLAAGRQALAEVFEQGAPDGVGFTGAGGKALADALAAPFENELVAQARAAAHLTPDVRSLIVVGGEDSFLVLLDEVGGDGPRIRDFAMNSLCAAGCGSFLDQQASRLGVRIEEEFGALALASGRPARIAGRCSVFAKSDMIHLQQRATPVPDIVAGLCLAFARNFAAVLARGKEMRPPIAFHGGVALNSGMAWAFRQVLGMDEAGFRVPAHAAVAGAVGAALLARQAGPRATPVALETLRPLAASQAAEGPSPPSLPDPGPPPAGAIYAVPEGPPADAYLGVDVGSISTNVVALDSAKRVLAKSYLMTAGRPLEAVKQGLAEVGAALADRVIIRGVCTTGSGRYLVGDFLGADLVKNEITAQARAAAEIDPRVDTIFEIGGQDSKYISLEGGAIVDFEMNKVCAAGTGSFLEEQAERLGVSIKDEFAEMALCSPSPARLGERCTVFMESDLVGQLGCGAATEDLAAGLAYSIVHNYLNRVVGERRIGERIFFQGGTAFNRAVVAAFRQVTGKPVTVPEHHEVTGAIGCALLAMEAARPGAASRFKGWDISRRAYEQDSFECKACANRCEINRIQVAGEEPLFYGGRCERYEKRAAAKPEIADLFAERERLLTGSYREEEPTPGKPLIGISRALHFGEYLPFWLAFFARLGLPVRLSNPTTKTTIRRGTEATLAEFCFPVKVAHGHALELMDAGVTHLFEPCVTQLPKPHPGYRESVPCPYVQSMPYTLSAALTPGARGVKVLAPVVDLSDRSGRAARELHQRLGDCGIPLRAVKEALEAAHAAQREFRRAMLQRGREALAALPPVARAMVIISRPYNGCDSSMNLELPRKFRDLGVLSIPLDMLPVDEVDLSDEMPDLTWRYGQRILAAADVVRRDPRLAAVYLTNFACGPDSFLLKFFRARMAGEPFLQIEVDEHSGDVGAITRCEAFLDSLRVKEGPGEVRRFNMATDSPLGNRTIYIPYMCDSAHAVAASFRSVGVSARVLPETTGESIALAKRHCTGKECFPCLVTTGDMLRQLAQPGVRPREVAFFMPTAGGGCRFGYYSLMQRIVLEDLGLEVPIFSPNQNRGLYGALGAKAGERFVRRAWQGILGVELLEKALLHVRPRERERGAADRLYAEHLDRLIAAVEAGEDLAPLMRAARADFAALPAAELDGRPLIGIVGEIFIRSHRFSNQHLIRRLEELSGRAWLAPFSEWIFYVNLLQKEDSRRDRRWGELLLVHLVDRAMKREEHRLTAIWEGFIPNLREGTAEELVALGRRYMDPAFRGEAIIGLGKADYFYRLGLAGIVNVMPFTCMPGTISSGMLKRFQSDHGGIPVLNLAYDGQEVGDLHLRLEAFMQQCLGYLERRA